MLFPDSIRLTLKEKRFGRAAATSNALLETDKVPYPSVSKCDKSWNDATTRNSMEFLQIATLPGDTSVSGLFAVALLIWPCDKLYGLEAVP